MCEACAQLQASPSCWPLCTSAHSSNLLTDAVFDICVAGQEVKASSKKAQDSAADTVERAQRELQEERGRSKRLLEAARAGSMATQSAGGALAWCCDSSVASLLLSGRCWHWMQCSLGWVSRLCRRWSGTGVGYLADGRMVHLHVLCCTPISVS